MKMITFLLCFFILGSGLAQEDIMTDDGGGFSIPTSEKLTKENGFLFLRLDSVYVSLSKDFALPNKTLIDSSIVLKAGELLYDVSKKKIKGITMCGLVVKSIQVKFLKTTSNGKTNYTLNGIYIYLSKPADDASLLTFNAELKTEYGPEAPMVIGDKRGFNWVKRGGKELSPVMNVPRINKIAEISRINYLPIQILSESLL